MITVPLFWAKLGYVVPGACAMFWLEEEVHWHRTTVDEATRAVGLVGRIAVVEDDAILLAEVTIGEHHWEEKLAMLVTLVGETVRLASAEDRLPPWPIEGPKRCGETFSFWTRTQLVSDLFSFVGSEPWPWPERGHE